MGRIHFKLLIQEHFYSNQYTWTMPADIAGTPLDPTNISVIAFIAEGQSRNS